MVRGKRIIAIVSISIPRIKTSMFQLFVPFVRERKTFPGNFRTFAVNKLHYYFACVVFGFYIKTLYNANTEVLLSFL